MIQPESRIKTKKYARIGPKFMVLFEREDMKRESLENIFSEKLRLLPINKAVNGVAIRSRKTQSLSGSTKGTRTMKNFTILSPATTKRNPMNRKRTDGKMAFPDVSLLLKQRMYTSPIRPNIGARPKINAVIMALRDIRSK